MDRKANRHIPQVSDRHPRSDEMMKLILKQNETNGQFHRATRPPTLAEDLARQAALYAAANGLVRRF